MSPEQPSPIAVAAARTTRREHLIRFGLLGAGVILFFAGYQTGKDHPVSNPASNCVDIKAAEAQSDASARAITTNPYDPTGRTAWMNVAHLVSQNPDCFSPEDRAGAATILEGIAQAAAAGR